MSKFLWLRLLTHRCLSRRWRSASANRKAVSARRWVRPCLEMLEDRITPTTFTPSTFADDGTANSLRGVITQTNNDTGTAADTILLQAGTYRLSIPNVANNHDVSNSQGDLNITSTSHALVIQGAVDASGKPTTTIDAKGIDRVFQISQPGALGSGPTVLFKDVVVTGGDAMDNGVAGTEAGKTEAKGGGIMDYGGNVTLSNVVLQSNKAVSGNGLDAYGGGIYAENASLTIQSSVIQSNGASGGDFSTDGGGAYGGGIYAPNVTTLTDSTVSDNTLTGGNGDNITSPYSAGAASGGGVYSSGGGTTTITDSTLSGNTVTGGSATDFGSLGKAQGGGAYFQDVGNNLVNVTVAGNQAIGGSGTFANNPAAAGGGLFFASTAAATLTNITVAGNTVSNQFSAGAGGTAIGGGISNANPAAQVLTLTNALVAGNSGDGLSPDYVGTVSVNSGHNLIGIADSSSGFDSADNLLGSTANPVNPHLGPLQNNGGPTPTLALLPGSRAINAGDNSALSLTGAFDQRGRDFARMAIGTIDIGAFEVQQSPPTLTPPPPPSASPPSPAPPPTLHTPPLLAFFDSLLGGMETVNGNRTETVIDSIFGFPLLVSTYNGAGNLVSVTLFGIDVTLLFELL